MKQEPDRTNQHSYDNVTHIKGDETSILDVDSKILVFNRAIKERIFLLGEEYPDANGLRADWAHFDFMIGAYGGNYAKDFPDTITLLKVFWADLWEYLGPLFQSFQVTSEAFQDIEVEQYGMLKDHAKLRMEIDFMKAWLKKNVNDIQRHKMNQYVKSEVARVEAETEAIVAKDKAERAEKNK